MSTHVASEDSTGPNGRTGGLRLRWFRPPAEGASAPVLVTGVFDLLHVGHIRFLAEARDSGGALFVGVEEDRRVAAWKGPGRPVNTADERAEVLAALRSVDAVFVIEGDPEVRGPDDYARLLAPLRPVVYAFTAGDPLVEARKAGAAAMGAEVREFPLEPGHSTTNLVQRAVQVVGREAGHTP